MDLNTVTDFFVNLLLIISAVIGGASMIVAGLREIAKVTPTERDDQILSKVDKVINSIALIIDKIALNPPEDKARARK